MNECVRTYVEQERIDVARALEQHEAYRATLARCGANVHVLDVNRDCPDGVFIEDTAVVLDEVAVVTSMGTASRRSEPDGIARALERFRPLERVVAPATLEGGDVLRVGETLLVGRTSRTNAAGIAALTAIARPRGMRVVGVAVRGCLHLKSACTALPDGALLVNRAWLDDGDLHGFALVDVPAEEPDAANVALAGGVVCISAAHPRTAEALARRGFRVETIDLSEFAKAEGCTTCLSLIFEA
jgi:dimethylargininase